MDFKGREAELTLRLRPDWKPTRVPESNRRSQRILKRGIYDEDSCLIFVLPLTSNGASNLVELDIDAIRGRSWRSESAEGVSSTLAGPHSVVGSIDFDDSDEDSGIDYEPVTKRRRLQETMDWARPKWTTHFISNRRKNNPSEI